jgi:ubiquinone/menaquinone biosynthesis C-methylase UbiE
MNGLIVMNVDVEKYVRFCDSEFGKTIMKKEAEYIYNELGKYGKILDIGCGIGSFEKNLPSFNIIGLDVSEEMLEEARKRSDKTFIQGNVEELQFQDSIFDAVFTVTTLEFLDDYKKAVTEIARVTKPQGKIVVMMLNTKSEYFMENVERPGDYFQKIQHTNTKEIRDYASRFYVISKEELFLGIQGQRVFETDDENLASLYVLVGIKK